MAGIGHNRGRTSSYAIVLDLDHKRLAEVGRGDETDTARADIRRFLAAHGFVCTQGGTFFGDETIDAVRCVTVVQKLARKYDWFALAARDIRMLRIEEVSDLTIALDDQDAE